MVDSKFLENDIIGDAGIFYNDNGRINKYYQGTTNGLDVFKRGELRQSVFENVEVRDNNMTYGGNLFKIVNSNLLLDKVYLVSNDIFSKSGGVQMVYSNVEVVDSTFDMQKPDMDMFDAEYEYVGGDSIGGHFLVGPNSTLKSSNNVYKQSRSNIGGCIAIEGYSVASFNKDTF